MFGLFIAVLAGNMAVEVIEMASRRGFGFAMVAGSGIATADGLWAAVAATAGSAIRSRLAPWAGVLQWTAVAVLIAVLVAAVSELARGLSSETVVGRSGPAMNAYGELLAQTLRHPTTVILFGSLIIGTGPDYGGLGATDFVAGVFLASLSWQWILAAAGAWRGRIFSDRVRRGFRVFDCVVLPMLIAYIGLGLYQN